MKCAIQGVQTAARRRHAGRRDRGQGAGRADLARSSQDFVDDIVLVVRARPRARGRDARRDREDAWSKGAGAAGLAAMLADPERFRASKVATVLCGGNIDTHLLANVLVRDLVRQGRIARLRVAAQDRPARSPRSPPSSTKPASTSSRSTTAGSSPPAGQGHGDRGRMRGPRRPRDRRCRRATRSGRIHGRAGVARLNSPI